MTLQNRHTSSCSLLPSFLRSSFSFLPVFFSLLAFSTLHSTSHPCTSFVCVCWRDCSMCVCLIVTSSYKSMLTWLRGHTTVSTMAATVEQLMLPLMQQQPTGAASADRVQPARNRSLNAKAPRTPKCSQTGRGRLASTAVPGTHRAWQQKRTEVVAEEELVEVDQVKCMNVSREVYSMFARHTGSQAATIVRSVMGLDGSEAPKKLHASYNSRTLERVFSGPSESVRTKFGQNKKRICKSRLDAGNPPIERREGNCVETCDPLSSSKKRENQGDLC